MSTLDPEDAKLVTLARSARARAGTAQGAAVRDGDGRTYVAASVELPSLSLTALQVAVAMGATVIGVVSTEEKAETVRSLGAAHAVMSDAVGEEYKHFSI